MKKYRGGVRWLSVAAGCVLAPKCLLCLVGYAGLGAWLGLRPGGPELCGGPAQSMAGSFAWSAGVAAVVGAVAFRRPLLGLIARAAGAKASPDEDGKNSHAMISVRSHPIASADQGRRECPRI